MLDSAPTAIANALIGNINDGSILVGRPMPSERQLCERFSTSRPTVRAALQMMQSLGYVSLEPTRRPRAARPSVSGIIDSAGASFRHLFGDVQSNSYLDQIRRYIEVGGVRTAAQNATNAHITTMHSALQQCCRSVRDNDAFSKADAAFHRAIVEVTANPIILELHDRFVYELVAGREMASLDSSGNVKSYDEHCQIYEAIVDGDAELAMDIMDRHLSRSFRARLPRPEKLTDRPGIETDNDTA
ncbi:MAG: FCD domain-containing protein [Rhizobiaceae bacterium]